MAQHKARPWRIVMGAGCNDDIRNRSYVGSLYPSGLRGSLYESEMRNWPKYPPTSEMRDWPKYPRTSELSSWMQDLVEDTTLKAEDEQSGKKSDDQTSTRTFRRLTEYERFSGASVVGKDQIGSPPVGSVSESVSGRDFPSFVASEENERGGILTNAKEQHQDEGISSLDDGQMATILHSPIIQKPQVTEPLTKSGTMRLPKPSLLSNLKAPLDRSRHVSEVSPKLSLYRSQQIGASVLGKPAESFSSISIENTGQLGTVKDGTSYGVTPESSCKMRGQRTWTREERAPIRMNKAAAMRQKYNLEKMRAGLIRGVAGFK